MRTLGAVLAGGRSIRFGSDKAEALLHGRSLLVHATDALRSQCDRVVIVGRVSDLAPSVMDWPAPDLGPLGGVAGAINHAVAQGFSQVLSISVDCVVLPLELRQLLEPAPAFLVSQPVIGLWPVSAAASVETMLVGEGGRSMRAFARRIGARPIMTIDTPGNVNTPGDLDELGRIMEAAGVRSQRAAAAEGPRRLAAKPGTAGPIGYQARPFSLPGLEDVSDAG